MVADAVMVQPLLSVIVTVYVPADNPFLFWLVMPPPQLKAYGELPPLTVKIILPLLPPLQLTLLVAVVALNPVNG